MEENGLPDASFDAVLFHEALHHVVDERLTLSETLRVLKPGGVLGVCEWAWSPGDADLESKLEEEMREFGTLESPFTREYLDHVLDATGFVDIRRYHAVNGLFPEEDGARTLESVTDAHALSTNTLTARRPAAPIGGPT
jgi:SAM-dependent methyltransferase